MDPTLVMIRQFLFKVLLAQEPGYTTHSCKSRIPELRLGYSSNIDVKQFNENKGGRGEGWTHAILLSEIPQVTYLSQEYRKIKLDINEKGAWDENKPLSANQFISLTTIKVFLDTDPLIGGYDEVSETFSSPSDEVWDMDEECIDGPGHNGAYLLLDYSLQAGSGVHDLTLFIPESRLRFST